MESKTTLLDVWDGADAKERAEFISGVCKLYPSLVCDILIERGSCKASWIKQYLFDRGIGKNVTDVSKK